MSRRRPGLLGAALPGALALAACAARQEPATTVEAAVAGTRPDVVLILVEDADPGAVQYMPRLRSELTSRGTSFTNAFVTTPGSTPSRVSILTGRYAHGHGVLGNRAPIGSFRRWLADDGEQASLATWLQAAGYRTAMIGRYLDAYPRPRDQAYVPPGWDVWNGLFSPERYTDFKLSDGGEVREYGPGDYQTDVLRDRATSFLGGLSRGQPFFLQLSFVAPRAPHPPAARHAALFPGLEAPRGDAFNESDVSDKPGWLRDRPPIADRALTEVDEGYRERVLSLQAVDEAIGAVFGALRAQDRLGRTFVLFSSAIGSPQGAHRLTEPVGAPYDRGLRVPLIVRGPGVSENQQLPNLALNIDVAPTVAALCGLELPASVDGASLVPLLGEGAELVEDWRRDFVVEHWDRGDGDVPQYSALRSEQQLYVEYSDGALELYDLAADPEQLENLADEADPLLLEPLQTRLGELRECAGEACRTLPPDTEAEEGAEATPDVEPAQGAEPEEGTPEPEPDLLPE